MAQMRRWELYHDDIVVNSYVLKTALYDTLRTAIQSSRVSESVAQRCRWSLSVLFTMFCSNHGNSQS